MTDNYWKLMNRKNDKKMMGICYCKEEKKLGNENKCIFCEAKTSDYDPDLAVERMNDFLRTGK